MIGHKVPAVRATFAYFRSRCYAEGLSKALVTQSVGAGDGLASERAHALKALPLGALRGVGDALRGDLSGLGRAGAIVVGLALTTWGYVVGSLRRSGWRLMIRVPILMYHSVSDRPNVETQPAGGTALGLRRAAGLSEGERLHPVDGGRPGRLPARRRRSLPERPVVVTFDDGYADFHSEALPLLERFGFPATVFLTSGWVSDAGRTPRAGRSTRC